VVWHIYTGVSEQPPAYTFRVDGKVNQIWRIETNEELDKLIKHKNKLITLKLKD
jgi:hypothetical protein